MTDDDPQLVYSRHCQSITRDGKTVDLHIFSSGKDDWILEVVDEYNNSIAWNDEFPTDDEAYAEFQRALDEEGIDAFIGAPP